MIWPTATWKIDVTVPTEQQPSIEQYRRLRRKGVRRTSWIAGAIAVSIFVMSILQMVKF